LEVAASLALIAARALQCQARHAAACCAAAFAAHIILQSFTNDIHAHFRVIRLLHGCKVYVHPCSQLSLTAAAAASLGYCNKGSRATAGLVSH
jgi:hypothetical protein